MTHGGCLLIDNASIKRLTVIEKKASASAINCVVINNSLSILESAQALNGRRVMCATGEKYQAYACLAVGERRQQHLVEARWPAGADMMM